MNVELVCNKQNNNGCSSSSRTAAHQEGLVTPVRKTMGVFLLQKKSAATILWDIKLMQIIFFDSDISFTPILCNNNNEWFGLAFVLRWRLNELMNPW